MTTKFALYDFNGTPTAHYVVDTIDVPKPALEKTVSHHIVIIDRSGSMWGAFSKAAASAISTPTRSTYWRGFCRTSEASKGTRPTKGSCAMPSLRAM